MTDISMHFELFYVLRKNVANVKMLLDIAELERLSYCVQ